MVNKRIKGVYNGEKVNLSLKKEKNKSGLQKQDIITDGVKFATLPLGQQEALRCTKTEDLFPSSPDETGSRFIL